MTRLSLAVASGTEIVRAWESGGKNGANSVLAKWARLNLVITGTVALCLILTIDFVGPIILGPSFAKVAPIVRLVAAGEFIIGIQWFIQRPLVLLERTRDILTATVAAAALNLALNLALVPRYGAIVSAWATLFTNVYYAWIIRRRVRRAWSSHLAPA